LKEQEFFAARDPDIAAAPGATRKEMIADLANSNPDLALSYSLAKREADGISHFARTSQRYPLCGRGRINTYALFAETARLLVGPRGRLGIIVPTGIATDATTQYFFRDVVESSSLAALYDFENARPLFEGVHRSFKFALLTLTGSLVHEDAADFAFFVHDPAELDTPGVRFALTPDEITLLNPNTGTSPIFRSRRDAEITLGIYQRIPILLKAGDPAGNPWGISFMQGLFNMTSDSGLFRTRDQLEAEDYVLTGNVFERGEDLYLPLYEAKMIHQYDHRWASYASDGSISDVPTSDRFDPYKASQPRYWVPESAVDDSFRPRSSKRWLFAFRNIARATDERTIIGSILPHVGVGHSAPLIFSRHSSFLCAAFASLPLDYVMRQKLGGTNLTFNYIMQLPMIEPRAIREGFLSSGQYLGDWVDDRVDELVAVSWELDAFAADIGDDGPPFVWDEQRRLLIRAELDAAFFHLFGFLRDEVEHVLGTFPIVKRKDYVKYGEYRTARTVLEFYDVMAEAVSTGLPYQTILDPPPGDGPRHPDRVRVG